MPRFRLENFEENVARLRRFLDTNDTSSLCAVFDVGTKSTKLLVGPKKPPSGSGWRKEAFFNDGQLFPLGGDYDLFRNRLDIRGSGALEGVCFFIRHYTDLLTAYGIPTSDIQGVGTAVFRWMNNRKEVLDHIRTRTGLDIHVLKPDDEAFLSCLSIFHTHNVGTGDDAAFGNDDVVLLFDQGGGSTEVSYFYPRDFSKGKRHSLDIFGTVYLQRWFFAPHDPNDPRGEPDPAKNMNRISKQFERVRAHLRERVKRWEGFPDLVGRGNVHAYGMGTALSKCLKGNSFVQHNKILTIDAMEAILGRNCSDLDSSKQQVRTLFAALRSEQTTGDKEISDRLVLLYGLPVYQQLLAKFGLDRLRFAGFGLRYGAYLAVCTGALTRPRAEVVMSLPVAAEPVQVFLSHSKEDALFARRLSESLREAGHKVWFDEDEIRIGDSILDKLQAGVSESRFLALLLSKNSLESDWVNQEWKAKWMEERTTKRYGILPIKIDDSELPPFLADRAYSDFRVDYKGGLTQLLQSINDRR